MEYMTKEKRYNTLNAFYRHKFGEKVFKIPLNGGFSCPNKESKTLKGGCIYCTESGSGDFAGDKNDSLKEQYNKILQMMNNKWNGKTIVYFQANTNTYKPVDELRIMFDEAISLSEDIVGLSIATRCDALDEAKYNLLGELSKKTYLQIELGLQSINDETISFMNRGHNKECFERAVKELRKREIDVVVHIINGFPTDSYQDSLNIIKYLNTLDIQGIKIHMLHVMRQTKLAKIYLEKPFKLFSLNEYRDLVIDQLELLNSNIIVHRITGDSPKHLLIEPQWTLKKFIVMNEIDKKMRETNSYQGKKTTL
ncbi:TIGR01212 family radical SAM protein [Candidatus Izimaplasma bacterium ZiA1]|uniref:TIGR01212 family radical SAM protein n=1 Tax=Candidatus Izimoplasma sp. ZiA1 TaxID=2024899 RepID=UPI001F0AA5F2